jgi:steroid 5-alpha reductase family enzyme
MLTTLITIGGVIFTFVTTLFILSIIVKRNDIADIAWGTGILIVAVTSYLLSPGSNLVQTIMLGLVTLWGVRLTVRILLRNLKKSEDYRYKKWRDEWGGWFYPRSYLQVYLLQGALMIVVGYPFIHASIYSSELALSVWFWLGLIVWCIGYVFEVVGDYQLDRFLQQPPEKGAIMQRGLWKYTRHPNYFGEVTMWWGVWLMVVVLPFSFVALMSPLMITFLILKVSGIPMLEEKFAGNPAWEAYRKRTSVFFPLPPRPNKDT